MSHLAFAERIKLKQNSGYDSKIKSQIYERREKAQVVERHEGIKVGKRMPKQKYSKLPVGIIKRI
jgi:hypothetical protein